MNASEDNGGSMFRVWRSRAGTKYCTLGGLRGIERVPELKRGESRADGFPADAFFEMSKKFPKQVALADSLSNLDGLAVVSKALKGFLEGESLVGVEFLPVSIRDHKGRVASADYFVVNPTRIVDCIDKDRSDISWNPMDVTRICGCLRFVLDVAAIDADVAMLRPKHLEVCVLVREDLAGEICDRGFTGTNLIKIEEFQY
ncbi:MAG: hypothetical protein IT372_41940 [Polyangiaceae bacterium]|nr:hypothetical protein [Polyangiaceae bacterium]